MQRMTVPFEVKSINEEDPNFFYFEGYASTFGNVDEGGDKVKSGAFAKTIDSWAKKAKKLPVLWQHDTKMPLGVYPEMREDSNGLFVKGCMPKSDTFVSGRVIPQMKVGSVADMSIGYYAIDFDYEDGGRIRNLKQLELCEVSLVTMPMNTRANVTSMKSISTIQDFPLAPIGHDWDSSEATARVASVEDLKSCFLLPEEDRLLIGDLVEGKFHIVFEALQSAAAAVQSGYKIPEGSIEALKSSIEFYYKRFGKESPFEEKACVLIESIGLLSERELERILKKGVFFNDSQAKLVVKSIMSARREGLAEAERDAGMKDLASIFAELKSI